ncbi:hypothetical protein APHMUC_0225 [Anaplasma phagocytophilum str. ApMUC09]|uniref:Uncharacterized protein n=1 Tax=Anaplasma phagocytophilum str. ApMUC09 TaxID=1359152 RepID=A0A0F3N8S5_ANAPH|nr:hypothetical protein APHMUC_0225 [Anaplasma phagocytophilum str. ApMUC09]
MTLFKTEKGEKVLSVARLLIVVITATMMKVPERFRLKASSVSVYLVRYLRPMPCTMSIVGGCLWGASKVRGISAESLI